MKLNRLPLENTICTIHVLSSDSPDDSLKFWHKSCWGGALNPKCTDDNIDESDDEDDDSGNIIEDVCSFVIFLIVYV